MHIGDFVLFEKKKNAPLVVEAPSTASSGDLPEPELTKLTAEQIRDLYIQNSWVRKYINSIVRACLHYKLQAVAIVSDGKNQKAIQQQIDEVNTILTYANPVETFSDIREKYLKDFLLFGNGALEIEPKAKAEVTELYAAAGYLLRANYDDMGNIQKDAYYFLDPETSQVNKKISYRISDIVHFKLDQLSDRFYGVSPMESVAGELSADTKCQKDMSRGDFGVPHQIITFPKQTKTFIDKVLTSIQTVLTSKGGNKVVAVNVDGVSKVALSDKTYKDEFEFQKWLVQRHNIYGIPPFKLGFVSEVGSMSAKEQREEFLQLVETIVTYECEKLSLILCKTRLKYEGIKIIAPALITRLDYEKARVLDRLVGQGIITPNEAREKYLGIPKLDDPEADSLKTKAVAPAPQQIIMPAQPQAPQPESDLDKQLKLKKLELLGKQEEIMNELSKEKTNENHG